MQGLIPILQQKEADGRMLHSYAFKAAMIPVCLTLTCMQSFGLQGCWTNNDHSKI